MKKTVFFFILLILESLCWLGLLAIVHYYTTGLNPFKFVHQQIPWESIYVVGLYILIHHLISKAQRKNKLAPFLFNFSAFAKGFAGGISLVMVIWIIAYIGGILIFQHQPVQLQWFFMPLVTGLLVAWIEERMFRGIILDFLLLDYSPHRAAAVQALIFSLLHQLNTQWSLSLRIGSGIGLFLVGWILSQARLKTGGLSSSMGLHSGWIFICLLTAKSQSLSLNPQHKAYWALQELNPVSGVLGIALLSGVSYVIMNAKCTPAVQHER